MKRHVAAGPLTCVHCGQPVTDNAQSPTGLAHVASRVARCDGKRMGAAGRSRTNLAVAA